MRKTPMTTAIGLALAATFALAGCSSTGSATADATPKSVATQQSTQVEKTGTFAGLNDKKVAGTVTVTGSSIALAGFTSDEGPDLHIYLTNATDEAGVTAGVEVSAVAFDKATQTFTLDGIDTSAYTYVVIHCDKAKAVFGAAKLA